MRPRGFREFRYCFGGAVRESWVPSSAGVGRVPRDRTPSGVGGRGGVASGILVEKVVDLRLDGKPDEVGGKGGSGAVLTGVAGPFFASTPPFDGNGGTFVSTGGMLDGGFTPGNVVGGRTPFGILGGSISPGPKIPGGGNMGTPFAPNIGGGIIP